MNMNTSLSAARTAVLFITATIGLAGVAGAEERNSGDLSPTELMNEPVTSVSKKETRLGDSATAGLKSRRRTSAACRSADACCKA